jgi:hypothetical protein
MLGGRRGGSSICCSGSRRGWRPLAYVWRYCKSSFALGLEFPIQYNRFVPAAAPKKTAATASTFYSTIDWFPLLWLASPA